MSTAAIQRAAARTLGVRIEPVDAAACGAGGCRRRDDLYRVEIEAFGRRVLCARCALDLLQREVVEA